MSNSEENNIPCWLSHLSNPQIAATMIFTYYQSYEIANVALMFTGF